MSGLSFAAVQEPNLTLDLSLERGVFGILGKEASKLNRLLELALGLSEPKVGRISIQHQHPYREPSLRRRIGSLLPEESLLPARSVTASVSQALTLVEASLSAAELLSHWELHSLAARNPESLSPSEVRSVALALALSLKTPALLALQDPFDATTLARSRVRDALREHAKICPVLLLASSPQKLSGLETHIALLSHGRLIPLTDSATPNYPLECSPLLANSDLSQQLIVVTPDPARLAAAVKESGDWAQMQVVEASGALILSGAPAIELSRVLSQCAGNADLVQAIYTTPPSLQAIQTLTGASKLAAAAMTPNLPQRAPEPT